MISKLKLLWSDIYYTILLLRIGGVKVFLKQIVRQLYSRSSQVSLVLDLQETDVPKIEAKIKYTLNLASKEDMDEMITKARYESKDMAQKLVYRKWLYDDGYQNCYVARTTDTAEICMIAFIFYPEDENLTKGRFRGWFPTLKSNEALLEGGYTFEKFRGNRIHPSVITDRLRICKEKGYKRILAFIEKDNANSLKGAERAGFKRVGEAPETKILLFTRRKFYTDQIGAVIIGGQFQGLGLLRSLAKRNIPTYLLDTGMCIAKFSKHVKRFSKCPEVENESFYLKFLMDLAVKENLKGWLIYPNDDKTVRFLSEHKKQLEEYYRVTTPPWDIIRYAYDKEHTYKLAEKCGVTIPRTFYPRNSEELEQLDLEFPMIIKPSTRQPFLRRMGKKAILVENMNKLKAEYAKATKAVNNDQYLMIQEFIPGRSKNLFSVGSLSKNGDLLAKVVVQRFRQYPMDFGRSSTFVQTADIPELEEITSRILGAIGYSGLSEVEFMFDPKDGRYKLLEINARAWGWHTIAIGAGVDLPYLSYQDILGKEVKQNSFSVGTRWFHMAIDFPVAVIELLRGRMKLTEYLTSLKGKKEFAVISLDDPLPFIMEVLLLPYLWLRRGL